MGKLYFIGAGPGDPELITVKGQRLIAEADVIIYAGSLVNPEILKYGRKDAEIYNSATMNLDEVLGEWERMKQENAAKHKEEVRKLVLQPKWWLVCTPAIQPFTVRSRNRWTVCAQQGLKKISFVSSLASAPSLRQQLR